MGDNWQDVISRKHRNSKEKVSKISKSIFVTNFPDSTSARDLWKTCSVYGTVVDVFIHEKNPKRVRFDRPHRFNKSSIPNVANDRISPRLSHLYVPQQYSGQVGSFANAVNGMSSDTPGSIKYPPPALVLDDTCLAQRNLAYHVMGKVKDFAFIPNLYTILKDDGFFDIKVSYLSGTWVLFELKNKDAKENFMKHNGIKSWLYEIQDARTDFVSEERIVWMDIEGIPLNVWTRNTFEKIVKGKVFNVRAKELFTWNLSFVVHKETNYASEEGFDHVFGSISLSHNRDNGGNENTHSEDPFEIYQVLENKKGNVNREPTPSLSYPPGFTPEGAEKCDKVIPDMGVNVENVTNEPLDVFSARVMNTSQDVPVENHNDSMGTKVDQNGGSVLGVMEDIIRIGQSMGYTMEGCVKEFASIIGQQGDNHGNSGGILCIWEASIFKKENVTISDNYIAIYGTWLPCNANILFVVVYAPQLNNDERCGSCFNPYGSRYFDCFISTSGMVDVSLKGYKFTWSHPSASKMSKLDHFLVSDGIFAIFPSIAAVCLDRHQSDHWPIMHREAHLDFGPTLFHFYRSWFELDGFDDLIKLSWQSFSFSDFDDFKVIIRRWNQSDDLESNVTCDEIQKAVWNCRDNKSPGPDGQILDGTFIVDKILNWCKRAKKQVMFFKIDFAKAYDSVRWDYLLDVLEAFGFENKWRSWIRGIFNSNRASILVNGSPSKEFSCFRGLKQGDPLAPYPFILIMETLHLSFNQVVEEGLFKGIHSSWSPETMELIRNHFFNGADLSENKITWVAWDKVLTSMKNGGLGVSSFFSLNRALLLKWVWRFVSQDGSLWYQVIRALYGLSVEYHRTYFSSNWCSILREVHKLKDKGFDFWSHCKKRIGDCINTSFWPDPWLGDIPLKIKYPCLFSLELDKDATVAVKLQSRIEISFCRNVRRGIEQHLMEVLASEMDSVLLSNSCDRWRCDLSSDGDFRVKEVRYRPRLNLYWRVPFMSHGGPSGGSKIVPSSTIFVLDGRRFLTILFRVLSIGVIVVVIRRLVGRIG
nr:RNA-directed DNA polymerase, eukaryota [Tanacetum cinerariifolium]